MNAKLNQLIGLTVALFLVPIATLAAETGGSVLKEVRQLGVVRCSVSTANGFASHDESGRPIGFMVDLCRAVAAATLGNAEAIELRRFSRSQEYSAIENGDIDVSFAMNGWTLTRPPGHKIKFAPPIFYDSQAIAAWRDVAMKPVDDRQKSVVCVPTESSAKENMETLIRRTGRKWTLRTLNSWEEAVQAFLGRECSLLTGNRTALINSLRSLQRAQDGDIVILPEAISRQALAPMVSANDHQWESIIRWTIYALFIADEKGITAASVRTLRVSGDQETKHLLEGVSAVGSSLGLANDWVSRVITQVGNYGEIFERNLGTESPFHMERGLNKPWTQGGLLYSAPFQ
ncbi:transporter substrate-binding domain-containing protein [Telmatospirillum sp.]|uniref:transporter substrate-binding domain-containing protein n=1 Tax=Telmatospirillum sp. TaxID=2079197 RepID=UPI00283B77A6|nr:transporter substrate-binding domain-containing protein [Telmatospirillum sp.]MDR3440086.1 transporter substrate-binding domain-containing protein [Telmatospirillum sp.]